MSDGGFVFGNPHNIQPNVPPENIVALSMRQSRLATDLLLGERPCGTQFGSQIVNSRDRVFTALQRKVPDRVPTFELVIDSQVIDAIVPGADLLEFVDRMGLDAVVVRPDMQRTEVEKDVFVDGRRTLVPGPLKTTSNRSTQLSRMSGTSETLSSPILMRLIASSVSKGPWNGFVAVCLWSFF